MNIRLLLAITALVAIAGPAVPPAHACGEVMYRMGSALRYQAYVSRHPAQILLYGDTAVAQAKGLDRDGFRRSLENVGHRVTIVESPEALAQALSANVYDIVITGAGNAPLVGAALAQADREPTLIPVVERHADDSLRRQYPEALVADASLNRVLKRIERTMETRGS